MITAAELRESAAAGFPASLTVDAGVSVSADDLTAFREQLRGWIREHNPPRWRERMRGASDAEYVSLQRQWLAALVDAGYAPAHWPEEWGGGFDLAHQVAIAEELARGETPHLGLMHVGLYHAAATLLTAGTREQQKRFLPGIRRGEIWCQGFSEPNAGSDLAALRTRAVRDGGHYVVNGQKIWTSYAENADYCLLLVRTDPDAPKHRGITYLVLDVATEGVDVRPIETSTHDREFCEVFLTDVRVPVGNRLGEENEGWPTILRTLSEERGPHVLESIERLCVVRDRLAAELAERLPLLSPAQGGSLLERYGRIHAETEALRLLCYRMLSVYREAGRSSETSYVMVAYSETLQRLDDLGLAVRGMPSLLSADRTLGVHWESGEWMVDYLDSWMWTISGGSNEIQRNIISERILGLPRG
jgi:alkylation response protein AidB-like acyl-CoA dehydrogenase